MLRHNALPDPEKEFKSKDISHTPNGTINEKLFANFMAPDVLKLKLGSQVMLIVNRDESLVNGSVGMVVGFQNAMGYRWEGGEILEPKGTQKLKAERDEMNDKTDYPIVRFSVGKGEYKELLVKSHNFSTSMQMGDGKIVATRNQVSFFFCSLWSILILMPDCSCR